MTRMFGIKFMYGCGIAAVAGGFAQGEFIIIIIGLFQLLVGSLFKWD